jgi:hypothetical protein
MPDAEMLSFLLNAYEKTFHRSRIRRLGRRGRG